MTDTMATELSPTMALPKDFKSIREISDMDAIFVAKQKPFVNVVGLIRDYQPPRQTGGSGRQSPLFAVL
jgi:hypothetical protein